MCDFSLEKKKFHEFRTNSYQDIQFIFRKLASDLIEPSGGPLHLIKKKRPEKYSCLANCAAVIIAKNSDLFLLCLPRASFFFSGQTFPPRLCLYFLGLFFRRSSFVAFAQQRKVGEKPSATSQPRGAGLFRGKRGESEIYT